MEVGTRMERYQKGKRQGATRARARAHPRERSHKRADVPSVEIRARAHGIEGCRVCGICAILGGNGGRG